MLTKIRNLAVETALNSKESTVHKHGAVLFSGGKILSTSSNLTGYMSHAETLAILKYFKQLKVSRHQ
jgi:pyrimidine deaminase RibD-like protein